MKDKDLKRIIQDDLESKFHLIEEGEEAKKGLTFTHNNKTNSFSKKRYALLTSICIVISIICSSLTSILVYRSVNDVGKIKGEYLNRYEAIEYALGEIEKQCDKYFDYPYVERQINENYYINIYRGRNSNNIQQYLYFFQFFVDEISNNNITLVFYDNYNYVAKYSQITSGNLVVLQCNYSIELEHLYLTIIENDIETANVTLF